MRVAIVIVVILLLAGGVVVSCMGSDDDPTPTATPNSEPDPVTLTATPTETPEPPVTRTLAPTSTPVIPTPAGGDSPTPTVEPTPTAPTLEEQAERILGLVPVRPADIDLFTSDYLLQPVYPEAYLNGAPMEPATGTPATVDEMRGELAAFLDASFGVDPQLSEATLELFDDPAIIERVPDPRLRAAFVLMNVTVSAPLIDTYINSGIYGGNLEWIKTGFAFTEEALPGPDGKQRIGVSERHRYEHFAVITPNIIHSMLHHDGTFSYPEDVVILTIATVSYLQLIDMHPEIAHLGTELSRFNNTFALALLNSHAAGSPDIRLIVPSGASVLPESPEDADDFWSMLAAGEAPSPSPDVIEPILERMLTPGTTLPSPLRFDRELAEIISGNIDDAVLDPVARLRISVLFTMISTDEIAFLLDMTREETIDAFDLAEIEAILTARP